MAANPNINAEKIQGNLSITSVSATTYYNLPVTADTYVTGFTLIANTITLSQNRADSYSSFTISLSAYTGSSVSGAYLPLSGGTVTGPTIFQSGLTANTISATTYYNLPTDIFVTGGTYTSGNAIFTNNTGGTFTVSGFAIGGGGGQIFYLNLSQTKNTNRYLSTTASTSSEQSTGVTISSGITETISSFQSDQLNTTLIPSGVWSFHLHSYKSNINATFDIFVEVYKRTSGGTQTLLFTTEPVPVTSNSPTVTMEISEAYFSGSPIVVTDSIVAVVRATNTSNQSYTITFFTEGSQHYSYVISTLQTQQGLTCDTLSGCSIIQTIQSDVSNKLDKTGGTISGDTIIQSGLTANTISATTFSGNGSGLTNVQNIYNSDGTISSDRYVSISGNTLWFSGLANGFQVIINDGITKPGFTILSDSLGGPSFSVTYDGSILIEGPAQFANTAQFDTNITINSAGLDNTSPYLLGLNGDNEVTTLDSSLLLNSITGGTYSGGTLSLKNNSGETISISGFSTGSSFTGGTVSGPTNFTSGLTANTISATTYQNLPATPFLPLTGGTITGNVLINSPTSIGNTALNVISQNTSQSIALRGLAGKGTNAYGVYCDVSPTDESNPITNGIGGYFEVGSQFGYGAPDNKYSLQLKDETEGVGKVLTCVTSDGKANWRDTINVSSVTATTITSNSVKVLPVALTVISNTASTNASLSSLFTLTLTGNTTLATPTNGFSGQRIVYRLRQDGTGNKLLTLSSGFRSGPITVTLSTAANTTDYLGVIYNEFDNKWDVLALNKGYS